MAKKEVKVGIYKLGFTFPNLTNKLQSKLPVDFEYLKIKAWLNLLNNNNVYVTKWNKPTSRGTKVYCKPLENNKQYIEQAKEIKAYADEVNTRLGTGFIIDLPRDGE